jgi:hypothetical protein
MEQPFYRLRELIKTKYGEDKFGLGCQLTAQWLNNHQKSHWFDLAQVNNLASLRTGTLIFTEDQATALRQLFGLKRNEELYTFPEHTPEHLKTKP